MTREVWAGWREKSEDVGRQSFYLPDKAVQNPSVSSFWRDEAERKKGIILPIGVNHYIILNHQ